MVHSGNIMHEVLSARHASVFVGIDPGTRGGLVAINALGEVLSAIVMPMDGKAVSLVKVREWLVEVSLAVGRPSGRLLVALEKPSVRPGQNPSGTLTMGMNWGRLQAALELSDAEYVVVTPQTWRRGLGIPQGSTRDQCKEGALDMARTQFPDLDLLPGTRRIKPHDGLVDAVLLAQYARKTL